MEERVRPYERDDFYELLHRREALARARSGTELQLGTQTALFTQDLEDEFLISSSSSEDGRSSSGSHHRGAAGYWPHKAATAVTDSRGGRHTAHAPPMQLREMYEALAAHRMGHAGASMAVEAPRQHSKGRGAGTYLTATWMANGSTPFPQGGRYDYDSDSGDATPRYSPARPRSLAQQLLRATQPALGQGEKQRQRAGAEAREYPGGTWDENSVLVKDTGRFVLPDARSQAVQTMLERLAAAAATRDVVCSACMKRVAPATAAPHIVHTSRPHTAFAAAHRSPSRAQRRSWSREDEREGDDGEEEGYFGISPRAGYVSLAPPRRSRARAVTAGGASAGRRGGSRGAVHSGTQQAVHVDPPPPEFLQGWLLRRSAARKQGGVAEFLGDSWAELRASSMSPHRAYSVRYPGPDAATVAGSGTNVMRESLRDSLGEARQYTGPLMPHQAAIEEYHRDGGAASGLNSGRGATGEMVRRSLGASLQRVRVHGGA